MPEYDHSAPTSEAPKAQEGAGGRPLRTVQASRRTRLNRIRWLRALSAGLPIFGVALYQDPSLTGAAIGLVGMLIVAGMLHLALRAYEAFDG